MKNNFIYILALFFFSFAVLLLDNVALIASFCFYIYLGIVVLRFFSTKNLSFDIVWMLGFIFIILSEMIFASTTYASLSVSKYIVCGNNVILLFYYIAKFKRATPFRREYIVSNRLYFFILLITLTLLYVYFVYPQAVSTLSVGRYSSTKESSLFGGLITNFGIVLPAFWAYYYNKKRCGWLLSLLFALPIFILLLLCGTRFPLLFSVLGYLLVSGLIHIFDIKGNDIVFYFVLVLFMYISSNFMLSLRVSGADSVENSELFDFDSSLQINNSVAHRILSFGSPEGVVNANVWIHDYCEKNGHTLGKQSSFIFYWWIPRQFWPNKPKMTGGWLPHLYGNFREGHSASVGLYGELFIDFGYFSFVFFALFGFVLKRLELLCNSILKKGVDSVASLIPAVIVPFVFFSVRSPITSFITMSISLILYYLILLIAFSRVHH